MKTSERGRGSKEQGSIKELEEELQKITVQSYQLPWTTKSKSKGIPKLPEWAVQRPYLTGSYLFKSPESVSPKLGIGSLPAEIQENVVLEDILYVLAGIEGKYVKVFVTEESFVSFYVDPTMETAMSNMVHRILGMSRCYVNLSKYVERHTRFEYGVINHALSSVVTSVLREYLLFIAQLENQLNQGKLTLQKLWVHVQPSMRTLEILDKIMSEVTTNFGGDLLNQIYNKTLLTGDQQSKDLLLLLMEKASKPFFDMLEQWIYKGVIQDPYGEFFIEEHEDMRKENLNEDYNDTYWEQRYTLKPKQVPVFLARFAEMILTTGKYLNVIRECGTEIKSTVAESLKFTLHEREYQEKIEAAYNFASKTLLNLLIEEKKLLPRLRSIKHYFLLDQGDFYVHFMDSAGKELRKHLSDIVPSKLNSLLELSVRTSIADADPYKDDLTCTFLPYTLLHQLLQIIHVADGEVQVNTTFMKQKAVDNKLTGNFLCSSNLNLYSGFEAFTFDYKVEWPLSLVLSRKALTKYQLIFRHLFFCKNVERQLCSTWIQHQSTRELDLRRVLASSYSLRQRMLNFLQNFEYYMMFEVLEPNWQALEQKLKKVSTIDEVLHFHNDFLDTCLKECMLTDPQLVKILTKLMRICEMYASFSDQFIKTLQLDDVSPQEVENKKTALHLRKTRIKVASEHANKLMNEKGFVTAINRYENDFTTTLKQLISALQVLSTTEANQHTVNLILRLDFNYFYHNSFQKDRSI